LSSSQLPSLTLLASGPGWIAIDKPAGMSVHNDPGQSHLAHGASAGVASAGVVSASNSVLDAISTVQTMLTGDAVLRKICQWQSSDGPVSPVHRLDRETSGTLLLSTNRTVASRLQTAFAEHQTEKFYLCLTRAKKKSPGESAAGEQGSWTYPLSDKAEGRRKPQGSGPDRKAARTDFQVLSSNAFLSLVFIELGTGRQHQIRRHALLAGQEVCGDKRYGDLRYLQNLQKRFGFSRLMLHAVSLRLKTAFEKIEVVSSPPLEFVTMLPEAKDLALMQSPLGLAEFLENFRQRRPAGASAT
jgi:23S rRNA-/tRNA-specific pseudouridylate synthase